jgi:hypothetical protein
MQHFLKVSILKQDFSVEANFFWQSDVHCGSEILYRLIPFNKKSPVATHGLLQVATGQWMAGLLGMILGNGICDVTSSYVMRRGKKVSTRTL